MQRLSIIRKAVARAPPLGYVALMRRLRALAGRQDLIDGGIVGAIVALGMIEIWAGDLGDGEQLRLTVGLLISALPLLARRRHPLAVLLVITAAVPVTWSLYDKTTAVLAAMIVAIYSVAAFVPARRALLGLAVVMSVFGAGMTIEGKPEDIVFAGVIIGGVWAAGRLAYAHRQTADAMADRAAIAERSREERARAAVAEERARIARELHDVVAHSISVMVVQAGAERRAIGDERAQTRDVLATIEQTGRATLGEMRRLLGMLRSSDDELELAPQPSMRHVEQLVEQVRAAGLPVTLDVEGDPVPLPPGVDLSAYRIVQEALTNALKHAGPASARVTVRYGRDDLDLEILDDGAGAANGNGDGGGHGLIGMRERVHLFGGNLAAGARRDGGYAVRARLPLER
jgi:signal transduction histidine kinase